MKSTLAEVVEELKTVKEQVAKHGNQLSRSNESGNAFNEVAPAASIIDATFTRPTLVKQVFNSALVNNGSGLQAF